MMPDIDFRQVATLGDALLERIDDLRAAAPVSWSAQQNAWIVTGHAEVAAAFRGKLPLTAGGRIQRVLNVVPEADRWRIPHILNLVPRFILNMDPPGLTRLRKLMVKAFSSKVAENQRPYVRHLVAETVAAAARRDSVDFVGEVGRAIAGRVILKLLDLPAAHFEQLGGWARALSGGLSGGGATPEIVYRTEAAMAEMQAIVATEIARRRTAPGEDFISALVHAEEDGDRLSDDEIVATCILVLIAGHDTTTNTMTLGTLALADRPQARAHIRDHPEKATEIGIEILRHSAMSTAQVRSVAQDFEWDGQRLEAGQQVYLMVAGANRDPAVFPDPTALDLERSNSQAMSFGPGVHHCIGHLLARVQLSEFFPGLVAQVDRIDVLDETLDWGPGLSFRGLHSLNLRLHPR